MLSDSGWTGRKFLQETLYRDSHIKVEEEPKTRVCGVCEPNQTLIPLPEINKIAVDPVILWDALDDRQTIRTYSDEEMHKWELSLLLHYTQGVREKKMVLISELCLQLAHCTHLKHALL